jgi:hypothetical protein
MDTRSGKIYPQPTDDEIKMNKLTTLSELEHQIVAGFPPGERPRELALARFLEEQADVKGLDKSRIMYAFWKGFDAGRACPETFPSVD